MLSKFRITIAVLAATVAAITVGLSPAPASASIGAVSPRLTVGHQPNDTRGYCLVTVEGRVAMTQTEARGLVDSGHKVVVRVWGEDPVYDDLMLGAYTLGPINPAALQTGYISVAADGLHFHKHVVVSPFALDEDSGSDPASGDELYAGVRLVNSDGTTIRSAESNRVSSHFEFGCP